MRRIEIYLHDIFYSLTNKTKRNNLQDVDTSLINHMMELFSHFGLRNREPNFDIAHVHAPYQYILTP